MEWPEISMQLASTHRACKFSFPNQEVVWKIMNFPRAIYLGNCVEIPTRKPNDSWCVMGFLVYSIHLKAKKNISLEALFNEALPKKGQLAISKEKRGKPPSSSSMFIVFHKILEFSTVFIHCLSCSIESTCYNSGYFGPNFLRLKRMLLQQQAGFFCLHGICWGGS